jgi:hypothetical protein
LVKIKYININNHLHSYLFLLSILKLNNKYCTGFISYEKIIIVVLVSFIYSRTCIFFVHASMQGHINFYYNIFAQNSEVEFCAKKRNFAQKMEFFAKTEFFANLRKIPFAQNSVCAKFRLRKIPKAPKK